MLCSVTFLASSICILPSPNDAHRCNFLYFSFSIITLSGLCPLSFLLHVACISTVPFLSSPSWFVKYLFPCFLYFPGCILTGLMVKLFCLSRNDCSQQLRPLSSFSFSFSSWWNCVSRNPMNSFSDSYITQCISYFFSIFFVCLGWLGVWLISHPK